MELSQFNLGELKQLLEQVSKEITKREKDEYQAAINEIYRLAHQFGISVKMLISMDTEKKTRKTRTPSMNVYRDPANPERTWPGRGPRPQWLKDALDAGAKLEEFRVPMRP